MCVDAQIAEVVLDMNDRAPSVARTFLRESLCGENIESTDTAQLLVSELVTNAIHHGLPPVVLSVFCAPDGVVVRVRDGSIDQPVRQDAGVDDESGRGVQLVDLLSDDWGVDVDEASKVVWFRLNL